MVSFIPHAWFSSDLVPQTGTRHHHGAVFLSLSTSASVHPSGVMRSANLHCASVPARWKIIRSVSCHYFAELILFPSANRYNFSPSGCKNLCERIDVELQAAHSLEVAMSLARAYERRLQLTNPTVRPAARPTPVRRNLAVAGQTAVVATSATTPLGSTGASPGTTNTTTTARGNRVFRYLTAAEMEERRRLGLCYNCDGKFSRNHNCKRLFCLYIMGQRGSGRGRGTSRDRQGTRNLIACTHRRANERNNKSVPARTHC